MKSNFQQKLNELEKNIGSLKFAVIIISCFATSMIVGTFLESYFGTEFANRMIYKTYWFMFIQFAMFLSIVFAATLRLPPKKRLYGFYTIHTGLVTIGIGSLITYISGVDGQLFLAPNETTRTVVLSDDLLKVTYPNEGKQYSYDLPFSGYPKNLNIDLDNIHFKKFIPFADGKLDWIPPQRSYTHNEVTQSSHYFFKNAFAEQEFTLSLHPEAGQDFQSTFSMGPLNVNYLPISIAKCFETEDESKVIFWNTETSDCFTPKERKLLTKTTSSNHRFIAVPYKNGYLTFFPEFSPFPMDANFKTLETSPIRVFSKKMFEGKPALFLFGKKAAFYDKNIQKWTMHELELKGKALILPWMGAELTLLEDFTDRVPFNAPIPVVPIQKNGNLIKGNIRAVSVDVLGHEYWATNSSPLTLLVQGKKVVIEVTKETIKLPFELTLTQFKMDKDPGTNNPSTYESFVKLFTGSENTTHHIYMNHPMKVQGYTFYQASYSQDDQGNYSSTLAVNVDQGRPLKYLGSLMLVFGSIWHYNLNKKKKQA